MIARSSTVQKNCLVLSLALSCLVFTACEDPVPATPADGSWLALYSGEPNADDVGFDGKLVRDGSCLYAEGAGGRTLLLLPAVATEWSNDDGGTLRLGDHLYNLGDTMRLGGSSIEDLDDVDWQQRPDSSCDTGAMFLVGV